MSQDRLDQSCHLPIGTRDAIHVPFVVAQAAFSPKDFTYQFKPGSFVRFTDDKFTEFVICEKEQAQGILNPFLEEIGLWEPVVVLLMPGLAGPVRHHFDIDPKRKEVEVSILEMDLEEAKKNDPGCAGCYQIRNNQVIRN